MLWLLWFAYCMGVVPTWSLVYFGLRGRHGRLCSWAVASVLAVCWPPFLIQYRLWLRRHPATLPGLSGSWVDELERELHQIG